MAGNYSHDIWRIVSAQNVQTASAAGTAVSTASLSSETYAIQVCYPGSVSSTGGVHIVIAETPVADSTSAFIPSNWVQVYKCTPGQKVSLISNDAGTPIVNIVQLTN